MCVLASRWSARLGEGLAGSCESWRRGVKGRRKRDETSERRLFTASARRARDGWLAGASSSQRRRVSHGVMAIRARGSGHLTRRRGLTSPGERRPASKRRRHISSPRATLRDVTKSISRRLDPLSASPPLRQWWMTPGKARRLSESSGRSARAWHADGKRHAPRSAYMGSLAQRARLRGQPRLHIDSERGKESL